MDKITRTLLLAIGAAILTLIAYHATGNQAVAVIVTLTAYLAYIVVRSKRSYRYTSYEYYNGDMHHTQYKQGEIHISGNSALIDGKPYRYTVVRRNGEIKAFMVHKEGKEVRYNITIQ